jgi:hypothetical protein
MNNALGIVLLLLAAALSVRVVWVLARRDNESW